MTHFLDTKGRIADITEIINEMTSARDEARSSGDTKSERSYDNLIDNLKQETQGLEDSLKKDK